jgi:glycosyltransferase involved in cell wall biosynthesis
LFKREPGHDEEIVTFLSNAASGRRKSVADEGNAAFHYRRMIYVDVTSSCKSPMNTGVQRVVREIFRSLSAIAEVMPVLWDPQLAAYCALSRRERGFLETPFKRRRTADAEPGRRANPWPVLSKLRRSLGHRWRRLDLPAQLQAGDVLFVPEIFQDNRIGWLSALADRTAARLAAVCHDAIAVRRPDITPPARQGGFRAYLHALGEFDLAIAVSRETEADLLACWQADGKKGAPTAVLGWPVNHAGTARQIVPAPGGGRPIVLCVGTFEPRKNHLMLLQAARLLWERGVDFELVLVGRTTAQWGSQVLAALEALRVASRPVRWLRHIDDTALRRTYEECSFTVFPSLIEGFGLPILESLWHGRPCVCGSNGALGEVTSGGGCLNVDQTDPVALAAAMERLLVEPAFLRRLSDEAAIRPLATWEAYADRLLPLLTGAGPTPAPPFSDQKVAR